MADQVTITNQALGFLGANPITSLSDNSDQAILAKNIYEDIRDTCLEEGDWSFALNTYKLVKDSVAPIFGEGEYYEIPKEIIRIVAVNQNQSWWRIEGNKIRTQAGAAEVLAVKRVTDIDSMSPMFRQALAARMAVDMALPITQSKTMHSQMVILFEGKMDAARANDGMQGTSRRFSAGRLVTGRYASSDLGGRDNVFGPYV